MADELEEVFSPDLVFFDSTPRTKEEVFSFIAHQLAEKGIIHSSDVERVKRDLKLREECGCTGIGKGIAIPHILLRVEQIKIQGRKGVFGIIYRSEKGIDWASPDGKPVRLVIAFFAPEEKREMYLHSLAEVARILSSPERVRRILRAKDREEVFRLITGGVRKGWFSRFSSVITFVVGLFLFFLLARFLFPHLSLPTSSVYQEFLHFNSPFWINREIFATTLFFSMVLGTLLFFRYRVAISALALSLLLVLRVMDIELTVKFMSIPTILFIIAVMVIVKYLEDKGVFQFLVGQGLRFFANSPLLLFAALMFFSTILAGLTDEVSAILLTFGLAMEISHQTKTPIIPYLLGLVMATNLGSALTLIGNPIGIYLGFAGGLTFWDFIKNASLVTLLIAILVILLLLLFFRKEVRPLTVDRKTFTVRTEGEDRNTAFFLFFLFLFFVSTHTVWERILGLEERTILLAAPLGIVGVIVFKERERGRLFVEKGPDWWTILYFMFLLANAACLEYTGVTVKIAYLLAKSARLLPFGFMGAKGESAGVLTLLLWGSGILSGFVDNLPLVAALVPVVKSLIATGMPKANLFWWALLFGGCFGGNLTMIGSTANLVAIGVYERSYRKSFLFRDWLNVGLVVTLTSLFFANLVLILRL
jgi:Na+/H+ antiporter NhaD/arsenite permease-like protein/mannitol/fructose-specific phosphotransferase system IIA component (Ntr-type)